jgi:endonuclease YncB( thermonuclease family)
MPAPKGTWDCSGAVIAVLGSMVDGKTVQSAGNEVDQYGRLIAHCSTEEIPDIGARLVASGLTWVHVQSKATQRKLIRHDYARDQA